MENFSFALVVDTCDDPWQTEAKEHVHGVRSCHVTDCLISVSFLLCCYPRSEGIRNTGADCDEGDGCYSGFNPHDATHHGRYLFDNERGSADEKE